MMFFLATNVNITINKKHHIQELVSSNPHHPYLLRSSKVWLQQTLPCTKKKKVWLQQYNKLIPEFLPKTSTSICFLSILIHLYPLHDLTNDCTHYLSMLYLYFLELCTVSGFPYVIYYCSQNSSYHLFLNSNVSL